MKYIICNYNASNLNRTIVVSLSDKISGVKASMNIGKAK